LSERILVVDDEKDICRVLTKILELVGYEVESAATGEEALGLVPEFSPELVFLDYMMPDMTGLEVLREIKKRAPDVYVVMVTGRGSEEVAASVMKAGASDYVIKPFERERIVGVAKDTLRIRRAELDAGRLRDELNELNRELEKKVQERTRDLAETQERLVHQQNLASLGEMSGGMAHEIRNPLNSISLYAQLITDDLPEDDSKKEYVEKILSDVDRINDIVSNLNAFSRRIKRDKTPLDLKEVVSTVMRSLSTQFSSKGVDVRLELPDDLPAVLASSEEMDEVFSHLLINSLHAMPDGGEIVVTMRTISARDSGGGMPGKDEPPRQYIEVSVADNGAGISKDDIDRIFIPFFTTKADWKGTGLGLSVVHRIVNDHGGSIDVESEVGKGTTITFRMPVLESGALLGGDK